MIQRTMATAEPRRSGNCLVHEIERVGNCCVERQLLGKSGCYRRRQGASRAVGRGRVHSFVHNPMDSGGSDQYIDERFTGQVSSFYECGSSSHFNQGSPCQLHGVGRVHL